MQTPNPPAPHPQIVRDALASGLVHKAFLATRAKVAKNSLLKVDSDDWNPTWKTLRALCDAVHDITRERENAAQ